MNVTILPPGPQDPELFFDQPKLRHGQYDYDGKRQLFAFSEWNGIHTKNSAKAARKPSAPEWAWNDSKLRAVILDMERVHNLEFRCGRYAEAKTHRAILKRIGSYRALLVSIAYRSWRMNEDSVDVAAQLGITPCNVRQYLFRMRRAADRLANSTPRDTGYRPDLPHYRWHVSRGIKKRACKFCYPKAA